MLSSAAEHALRYRGRRSTLVRHSAQRPGRLHDSNVMVIRSNLRWRSDVLELLWWNGETVRITLVINTHDREIIVW